MNPQTSLQTLVQEAQAGDPEAFSGLVDRCTERVESTIRKHLSASLRDKLDIQDLAQETFIRAWQALEEFQWEAEGAFWSWLTTVVRSVVQMEARRLRAKKRDAKGQVSLQQHMRTPGGGIGEIADLVRKSITSPSQALCRDERFERLREAMRQLPSDYRKVVYLVHVRGLHTDEVARRMERTPGAVSTALYRALLKLKTLFSDTGSLGLPDRSLEEEGL